MKLSWLFIEEIDPLIKHQNILMILSNKLDKKPEEIIQTAIQADPTGKKYVGWILRQWKSNNIRLPEDSYKVTQTITSFDGFKKIPSVNINKDINSYGRFSDLDQLIDKLERKKIRSKREEEKDIKMHGANWYAESKNYKILKVISPESAVKYSENTKWCTSKIKTASEYLSYGPLYIIFRKRDDKLIKIAQYTENFDEINDILNRPFAPDEELQEIMGPAEHEWWAGDPEWAAGWAFNVINRRFPEAEETIKKDPTQARTYAQRFIGRWPEAEWYILKDAFESYLYALHVIKGRWPIAETIIKKLPWVASWYAKHLVNGRWLEAEENILKDPEVAAWYQMNVIKDRWPEAENVILARLRTLIAQHNKDSIFSNPMTTLANYTEFLKNLWPHA